MENELSRRIYLDYAGAAIPSKDLLQSIANSFINNDIVWANPHSSHEMGQKSRILLYKSREKVLAHFEDVSSEFVVIFTVNATAGLKLLAETFNSGNNDLQPEFIGHREFSNDLDKLTDCSKRTLLMLKDSHTSVVGMRQIGPFERIISTEYEQLKEFLNKQRRNQKEIIVKPKESLFVMTAMSNFCGRIYDLEIVNLIKQILGKHWKICIDAAALAPISTNIGLSYCDFAVISFYKMFGYPTGLGALLVRRNCANLLKKQYFGGGTVNYASISSMKVSFREDISERFEDGTPNICAIQALLLAFQMENITTNLSMELADQAFDILKELKHHNGNPLAIVYGKGWAEHKRNESKREKMTQGPIVNFNLLRDDGSFIGFVEVERMADLFGIQLRTGCHCNLGACAVHLGLNEKQLSRNFQMGKVCGDNVDIVDGGQPLGSVRISFGKNSTVQDILFFRQMLECCFISPNIGLDQPLADFNRKLSSVGRLTNLFIYPIKSCSAIPKKRWPICYCSGTLLHDRQLVIVNKNTGEWITQKRFPSICSIQIEMNSSELILSDRYKLLGRSLQLPFMLEGNLENNRHNNGISCSNGNIGKLDNFGGKEASIWLEQFDHSLENCELMTTMFSSNLEKHQNRANFSNRADFLLITSNSAKFIAENLEMPLEQVIERFRPNFVVDFGPNWKPFQEERIKRLSIGSMKFKVIGQCQRCHMICIDQKNGEKNPNILIGLRNMRLGENRPLIFGVYLELEREDGFIGNRELQTGCNVHLL